MNDLPELDFGDLPELNFEEDTKKPEGKRIATANRPSIISPIEIGQMLSGSVPQAVSSMASRGAVEDPKRGLAQFLGLAGATGAVMAPAESAVGYAASKLLDVPQISRGAEVSKGIVSRIPQQFLGSPEPMTGALGALGQLGRTTTPEQYKTGLKLGVGALASRSVRNVDEKYANWATNTLGKLRSPNEYLKHEEIMKVAKDTQDLNKSYIGQIKNDIKDFRGETAEIKLPDHRPVNETLYNLYEGSGKAERAINKAILPQEVMDDLGNIAKTEIPKSNLGLVYKLKDTLAKHIKWDKMSTSYGMPEQIKMRKAYFELDGVIKDTLKATKGYGDEAVANLEAMNSVAEEAYDMSRSLNKITKGISKSIPTPERLLQAEPGTEKWEILRKVSEVEPKMHDIMNKITQLRKTKEAKQLLKHVGIEAAQGAGLGMIVRGMSQK